MSDSDQVSRSGLDLEAWAAGRLGAGVVLIPMTGDASTRAYVRAEVPRRGTMVLMVTGHAFPESGLPWCAANELFLSLGLPVPQVLMEDADAGILVLEDLGDELLQNLILRRDHLESSAVEDLYRQALGMLRTLRRSGTSRAGELRTVGTALDEALFRRELDFFAEHYLEGHLGYRPGKSAREVIDRSFRDLAARAAAGPRVLCHRDFHARNLLAKDNRLRLLDHQDARPGPDLYDLASLLRDPYVELSGELERSLLAEFLRDAYFSVSGDDHLVRFDEVALQRDLKALGTFGYQAVVRGKASYLEYVPRAAYLARHALERLPDRSDLLRVLEDAGLFREGREGSAGG